MNKIASFTIDHIRLVPGIYVAARLPSASLRVP